MTITSRTVCLIPARGGSKRIPQKNIRPFLGKPIIAWSIEMALSTGLFDEVLVSTDDDKIANIAISYGAKVPFMRDAKIADDIATITDVIKDTLQQFSKKGVEYDYMLMVYATAPNVQPDDVFSGWSLLRENGYDTVFPIVKYSFPIQRAFYFTDRGTVDYIQPEHAYTRSQDLTECYHDAGQWIWIDIQKFIANGHRLVAENSGAVTLNPLYFHDIDDETDWLIAEQKAKLQKDAKEV